MSHVCFDCPRAEVRMTQFGRKLYCKEFARQVKNDQAACEEAEENGYFEIVDLEENMPTKLPTVDNPPWKVQDNCSGAQIRSANNSGIVASVTAPECCWKCPLNCRQKALLTISEDIVRQVNKTAVDAFVRSVKDGENKPKVEAELREYMFRQATHVLREVHSAIGSVEIFCHDRLSCDTEMATKAWRNLRALGEYAEALALWYWWKDDEERKAWYKKDCDAAMKRLEEIRKEGGEE